MIGQMTLRLLAKAESGVPNDRWPPFQPHRSIAMAIFVEK
jgi:hypothetical protein